MKKVNLQAYPLKATVIIFRSDTRGQQRLGHLLSFSNGTNYKASRESKD